MTFRLSLLLNLLLSFGLIWMSWPLFQKQYKQDGSWQLADPDSLGPDARKVTIMIADGLVIARHDGCNNAGTDARLRSPYWITDLKECSQKPVMTFMQSIHPFAVVEYDPDHDIVFAPDHMSGRKFVRKRAER
jgi:hypothetical protein